MTFGFPKQGHVSSFHGTGSHLEVTWFQFFLKWRWPWSSTLGSRPWCLVSEKHIVKGSQLTFLKVSRDCKGLGYVVACSCTWLLTQSKPMKGGIACSHLLLVMHVALSL